MSACRDAEILTREYVSQIQQYISSFSLLHKVWEVYWQFRKACKKAQNPMEPGIKKCIRKLEALRQAPELDKLTREDARCQVVNILDMLYFDAKSNARTYVEKDS